MGGKVARGEQKLAVRFTGHYQRMLNAELEKRGLRGFLPVDDRPLGKLERLGVDRDFFLDDLFPRSIGRPLLEGR